MVANSKVTMTGVDGMAKAIKAHDLSVIRMITGQFEYGKGDAESFARQNAPWMDRTGNARSGLHAATNYGPISNFWAELIIAHSVSYGIWLEVRFSGKYAIIQPTVDYIGQILISRIASSLDRMAA